MVLDIVSDNRAAESAGVGATRVRKVGVEREEEGSGKGNKVGQERCPPSGNERQRATARRGGGGAGSYVRVLQVRLFFARAPRSEGAMNAEKGRSEDVQRCRRYLGVPREFFFRGSGAAVEKSEEDDAHRAPSFLTCHSRPPSPPGPRKRWTRRLSIYQTGSKMKQQKKLEIMMMIDKEQKQRGGGWGGGQGERERGSESGHANPSPHTKKKGMESTDPFPPNFRLSLPLLLLQCPASVITAAPPSSRASRSRAPGQTKTSLRPCSGRRWRPTPRGRCKTC